VLIPRQETEELVNWIVKSENRPAMDLLDIGTGSGCIAIALAANIAETRVSACDISESALEVSAYNATMNKIPVCFFKFDALDDLACLPANYHVIVSNPPYVRESEKEKMLKNVTEYEPALALFVRDKEPLIYYKRIALLSRKHLQDGGSLYFEINEHFPDEIVKLLKNTGFYAIEVKKDINGKARMVRARK
jgi:release factor glutamine methyltransferase